MSNNLAGLATDVAEFRALLHENKFNLCRLVYIIFPFGQKGTELEKMAPYDWQMEEWAKLSKHLTNPLTRFKAYKLNISSGNGAAKTSFMTMTAIMLMMTHMTKARFCANTLPQLRAVTWPELGKWFNLARYGPEFFELQGEQLIVKQEDLRPRWWAKTLTWDEHNPAGFSGFHNLGHALFQGFDEAAGIPAIIWQYANGGMTDVDTIKIWIAVGNSDDPDSKFEQNMLSPEWVTRRIDTRTQSHVDKSFVASLLRECNGDEDHDDFRVRVRGLPRKSAVDSIIRREIIEGAINAPIPEDPTRKHLPSTLTCDPAWRGGDETVLCHRQGNVIRLLERFKLLGDMDHRYTYNRLCYWEKMLSVDRVFIDQAEGTALYTLAQNHGKNHWTLVAFGSSPNDQFDVKDSEYSNRRAQMYYMTRDFLIKGGRLVTDVKDWEEDMIRQLTWAKETRHKVTGKKSVGSKVDIKKLYGKSPDVADAIVLCFAEEVNERLWNNQDGIDEDNSQPEVYDPYKLVDFESFV